MTGQDQSILERYLERQDDMLLRLDDRLTAVEARQMTDQAANNQRFDRLEAALLRIEDWDDAFSAIKRAANLVNWLVDHWKKALVVGGGMIAFAAFVIDAMRWVVLGWPY